MTLVSTFVALYVSGFNVPNDGSRGRYVLPAYIPLFLLLGAGNRAPGAAIATGGGRRARVRPRPSTSGRTSTTCGRSIRRSGRRYRGEIATREALTRHLRARPPDALLLTNERGSFIWQFLVGLPVVSGLLTDAYYPSAVAADAANRVAILATQA